MVQFRVVKLFETAKFSHSGAEVFTPFGEGSNQPIKSCRQSDPINLMSLHFLCLKPKITLVTGQFEGRRLHLPEHIQRLNQLVGRY